MERFWNIVHYFVCKADYKLTWYFYKYTGLMKLYNSSFSRKRFEKGGIKDPMEFLMKTVTGPDSIIGSFFTGVLMSALPGIFLFFSFMLYVDLLEKKISGNVGMFIFISIFIFSLLFSHILLFHNNKFLKYFEEFDKMPREWRKKWKWISVGVVLFAFVPLVILFVISW